MQMIESYRRILNGQQEPRKAAIKNRLVDDEVLEDKVFVETAHETTPWRTNQQPMLIETKTRLVIYQDFGVKFPV
jgi:hypothetical protein